MKTAIQNALRVQRQTLKRIDGRKVVLLRGELRTENVTANIGETRSEDINEDNQIVTVRIRDWLIDVVDYRFGGQQVEPEEGDRLIYAGEIWEVHVTPSEPQHRRHDRDKTTWRVHYKLIGNE